MENEKIARFIAQQRRAKGMTQKELAAQLGITDKAVSKWERGLSCPDISLLAALSGIFGVTTGELLNGEKAELPGNEDVEAVIEATFQYADAVTKNKSKNIRFIIGAVISALSFLGILTCLICNFAITGKVTWAWFPISSIVYFWLVVMPLIEWSKRGIRTTLILLSLLTLPFLYVLERVIGTEGLIMPIGIPVFIASILYLWAVYLMITRTKWPKYMTAAAALAAGLPISVSINYIISKQIGGPIIDIWDIISYSVLLFFSIVIFSYGYLKRRYRG
ncbi:MAG TPA: helix-turn-helix transcriptional regulator [Clostridiales bacterium]|nr:helix-turn-helix transcriptional regulator [Clostridiales bacterium]